MASFKVMVFLALLVVLLLPIATLGDDLSPDHAPFFEKMCDEVNCGQGTCKVDTSYPFNYICECDAGWKQNRDGLHDKNLSYLPCIIPNCTLNYSCQPAPPPVPQIDFPHNKSFFDPCYWLYCGEGTCNKSSTYKYTCDCNPGFLNLLNETHFPCYSQCALGNDCADLGITVQDTQTPSTNGKATLLPGKLHWMSILVIAMAMLVWK